MLGTGMERGTNTISALKRSLPKRVDQLACLSSICSTRPLLPGTPGDTIETSTTLWTVRLQVRQCLPWFGCSLSLSKLVETWLPVQQCGKVGPLSGINVFLERLDQCSQKCICSIVSRLLQCLAPSVSSLFHMSVFPSNFCNTYGIAFARCDCPNLNFPASRTRS